MQCLWLFDRSLTVGLIMNKDMESFRMHTPSPGRDSMEYLTACRHPASPNPWCLPSPSHWPGRGCVRGCQVARCHATHNGCRSCVCVCVCLTIILFPGCFPVSPALQYLLCLSPLLPPDAVTHCGCSPGLEGGTGWVVVGGGDGVQCGGQWVGYGCFLLYSGWLHKDNCVCV